MGHDLIVSGKHREYLRQACAVCPPDCGCGDAAKVDILKQSIQFNAQFLEAADRQDYIRALAAEVSIL